MLFRSQQGNDQDARSAERRYGYLVENTAQRVYGVRAGQRICGIPQTGEIAVVQQAESDQTDMEFIQKCGKTAAAHEHMEFYMVGNTGGITADIRKRSKSETDGIKEKSDRAAAVLAGALYADGGICICLDGNLLSLSGAIWKGEFLFVGAPPYARYLFRTSFLF